MIMNSTIRCFCSTSTYVLIYLLRIMGFSEVQINNNKILNMTYGIILNMITSERSLEEI